MKIKPGTPLHVTLEFAPEHRVPVGRLALDHGIAVLEYAPEFIASRLTINPLFETPNTELVRAKEPRTFDGLHGVLADSLPDSWGEELLRRRAAANGISFASLTTLDKLAIVGRNGMGALSYQPAFEHDAGDAIDLDRLAHEALEILEGHESECIPQLEQLGGSSGGARPKILVAMNEHGTVLAGAGAIPQDFDAWIVKFRSSRDVPDIGPLEAAYADMARASGITVSETKLLASQNGPGYFATKRFDRSRGGIRTHLLSIAGLLDLDWQYPSIDYNALLAVIRRVTRQQADVEEMFRRMVFNVIAHNRDDHTKQHAFLLDAKGQWRLAPAYDLTFSRGPGGEHYLAIDGFGTNIPQSAIRTVAENHGIKAPLVDEIITRVTDAVNRFETFANTYGVSPQTRTAVSKEVVNVI